MTLRVETQRLILEPVRRNHEEDLHRLHCDPLIVYSIQDGIYPTLDQTRERLSSYISQWAIHGFGFWMVYEKTRKSVKLCGRCGLRYLDGTNEMELAYCYLGDASGKGIATEAATATLNDAFDRLGLQRIVSVIRSNNPPSVKVVKKLGFHYMDNRWHYGKLMRYYRYQRIAPGSLKP